MTSNTSFVLAVTVSVAFNEPFGSTAEWPANAVVETGSVAEGSACIREVTARPSARPGFPQYTLDGDLETYWAAQRWRPQHWHEQHAEQWLTYRLSRLRSVSQVAVVWGTAKPVEFEVRISRDDDTWKTVREGTSGGIVRSWQRYDFSPQEAQYVRLVVKGLDPDNWYRLQEVKIHDLPYEPSAEVQWSYRRRESGPPNDTYLARHKPAKPLSYREMAAKCLRTVCEHGTDRYGPVHAPIWVLNFDLDTKQCFPRYNDALEERGATGLSYSSTAPFGIGHRAIGVSQRPAGCSNLFVDQPMIRAALLMDLLSGYGSPHG